MPIYEYVCEQCDHEFEDLVRSSSDAKSVTCPQCHSKKAGRKFSVFSAGRSGPSSDPVPAGCGRCGDPNGPCTMP